MLVCLSPLIHHILGLETILIYERQFLVRILFKFKINWLNFALTFSC